MPPSPCEAHVLGPLRVRVGGEEVALGGPRPRLLLALLLIAAGRPVSVERLIDDLYGDDPPATARKSVQVHVSNLRRALAPAEVIETTADGYRLAGVDVDAAAFEAAVEEAVADAGDAPRAAIAALSSALQRWRGAPYSDLGTRPAVRAEAARLQELRLRALEVRIDALLRLGDHADVLGELETLTRAHPFREEFRAQQMLALYRSNRQAEALRVYDRARELLVEELGIEPTSRLRDLHTAVLNQDPALAPPAPRRAADASSPRTVRGYELRQVIGRGPRGEVRRAYHTSTDREVAIKLLPPELANEPAFIKRFEAEAQFVAGLSHPWILSIEDYWRDPEGAYIVMPLLPGGSLADLLAEGSLDPPAALRVVDRIGTALAHAHRHGVAHGNLKPSNVLLDDHGEPHLSDFLLGGQARDAFGPTAADTGSGTDHPDAPPLEPSTDIADLARLFHELLTRARSAPGERLPPLDVRRLGTPAGLDDVLTRANAGTPADGFDRVEDFLRAVRQELGADVVPRADVAASGPGRNPYKGLRAFGETDAGDFHGRSAVVEHLLAALGSHNVVALVGPSGSGKSSVVRAGLLPAVRTGALGQTTDWVVADMFPGAYPFEELEAALLRVAADRPEGLLEQLAGDDRGLLRVSKQILPDDDTSLLLVVDQFEELFALVEQNAARDRFLASLVEIAGDARSRLKVVLTLRADFFDRPLQHPTFGAVIEAGTVTISMPSEESLAMAISRPAHAVGLELEPGLVPTIIADVIGEPGGLPLLQYCLTELVEHDLHDELSLAGYEEIGRAGGALARRAEQIFSNLPPASQEAARHVLLRLVAVSTDSDDTRRRVRLSQLRSIAPDAAALDRVIEQFGTHRLLTFDHDPITRGPTVEVAHEALITAWPRYARWITERRTDLLSERRLEATAAEWDEHDRDPDFLLRGDRLEEVEQWSTGTDLPLPGVVRSYVAASRAAADLAAEAEAEGERREVALRRRSRWLVASSIGVVAVIVLALLAWNSRSQLTRQAELADEARRLGAAAAERTHEDAPLAASLALVAVAATADTGEVAPVVVDALHWALQDGGAAFPATATTPVAVRPSPDGLRGVFLLPVDDVVDLARAELARPFDEDECSTWFEGGPCPDPTAQLPTGLAIAGGEDAYRALTEPDAPLTGTSVNLATWLPDSDLVGQPVADALLLESLARATTGSGITVTHDQVDTLDPELFDQDRVEVDVLLALERSVLTWAAAEGEIHDVSRVLGAGAVAEQYGPDLAAFVTVDGEDGGAPAGVYGVPTSLIPHSLVTYNRDAFAALGYDVPTTWDELVALSDRAVADGQTPWCWAGRWLEEPGGFPLADWPAGALLSESGPAAVQRWGQGDLASSSPEVRSAYDRLAPLVFTPGYSLVPPEQIPEVDFWQPAFELAAPEPGCLMLLGSTIPVTVLTSAEQLDRLDVFPLPPVEAGTSPTLLVNSSIAMLAVDSPENRRVIEAMTSPTFQRSYVDVSEGFIPPDPGIDTTVDDPLYLQTQPRRIHARMIDVAQTAVREGRIVFGPSARFPVEALPTLWTAPVDWYRSGGDSLGPVLEQIDTAVTSATR